MRIPRLSRMVSVILAAGILLANTSLSVAEKQQATSGQAPPAPEVTVITTVPRDTPVAIEFVGKTVSSRPVEIRSRVEGFREKRLYTEGSMVQEGDVLFLMDPKPFQADLRAAKAELAQQQALLENKDIRIAAARMEQFMGQVDITRSGFFIPRWASVMQDQGIRVQKILSLQGWNL